MFQLGNKDQIPRSANRKVIYFPNTLHHHPNKQAEIAKEGAKTISKKSNIELKCRAATQSGANWAAIFGKTFN